jgi:hypothetical protein
MCLKERTASILYSIACLTAQERRRKQPFYLGRYGEMLDDISRDVLHVLIGLKRRSEVPAQARQRLKDLEGVISHEREQALAGAR